MSGVKGLPPYRLTWLVLADALPADFRSDWYGRHPRFSAQVQAWACGVSAVHIATGFLRGVVSIYIFLLIKNAKRYGL